MKLHFTILLAVCLVAPTLGSAEEAGFVPLLNGKDLSGWVPCNIAPETFTVRDGMLVTSGGPVGTLRTAKMYENFIIELEWRHLKSGGNSGLFIWADGLPVAGSAFSRGIEVQILDPGFNVQGKNEWYSTHGDIFAVNGAKLPSRVAFRPMANAASRRKSGPSRRPNGITIAWWPITATSASV